MHLAAAKLVGQKNYKNFCKFDKTKPNTPYERTIYSSYVQSLGKEDQPPTTEDVQRLPTDPDDPMQFFVFVVHGKAFLWHQVRCFMAVLYLIGMGLETPKVIDELTDPEQVLAGWGKPVYSLAPDVPLVLVNCMFPPNTFTWKTSTREDNVKKQMGHPFFPKSKTFHFSESHVLLSLFSLWKEHATRAAQIETLLKSCLSIESDVSTQEEGDENQSMGYLMKELLQGVDPLSGWPLQPESKRLNSFQGCSKGKYTMLMKRPRTTGEKVEEQS